MFGCIFIYIRLNFITSYMKTWKLIFLCEVFYFL